MFSFLCIFPCEKYTFILVIITYTFSSINFMLKKNKEISCPSYVSFLSFDRIVCACA